MSLRHYYNLKPAQYKFNMKFGIVILHHNIIDIHNIYDHVYLLVD